MNVDKIFSSHDETYPYRLLSRMKSDCEYYLSNDGTNRHPKHLWAGNEPDQISYMKAIWNRLSEKPEWLSFEQILEYEERMGLKPSLSSQIHSAEEKLNHSSLNSEVYIKNFEPEL